MDVIQYRILNREEARKASLHGFHSMTKATAWMIRSDGKAIPCIQHIYANTADVEETLHAAEWLYANTRHRKTQRLALETIAAWASTISHDDPISSALDMITDRPYRFLSRGFIEKNAAEIASIQAVELHLPSLCEEVVAELNQEFLRTRYGGMYHTKPDSKELVFRISSIGFDWDGIIREFVVSAPVAIETVSVVRDEESTGSREGYYCRGILPENFLTGKKAFVVPHNGTGMRQRILDELAKGTSLRQLQWPCLPINPDRLAQKLRILAYHENEYSCGKRLRSD